MTVAKVTAVELQEQMTLQLAVTSSHSKINYGTWVLVTFGPIKASAYFDITNIDSYNAILGTPSLWEHGVPPIYNNGGCVMKDGNCIQFLTPPTPAPNARCSLWNWGACLFEHGI